MNVNKDASLIPSGEYCYRVVEIQDGEVLRSDIDRHGKDLREYAYSIEGYKCVLCPYWNRTDYGTVRCDYLEKEIIDGMDDSAKEKIQKHFGIEDATEKFGWGSLLEDEIKICDVNLDDEDEPEFFPPV